MRHGAIERQYFQVQIPVATRLDGFVQLDQQPAQIGVALIKGLPGKIAIIRGRYNAIGGRGLREQISDRPVFPHPRRNAAFGLLRHQHREQGQHAEASGHIVAAGLRRLRGGQGGRLAEQKIRQTGGHAASSAFSRSARISSWRRAVNQPEKARIGSTHPPSFQALADEVQMA